MSWSKFFTWIGITLVLILLLLFFIFFANLCVIGPARHYFNTKWAEEINADTWMNGFADIYTVEAKISINDKEVAQTQDIVFVRKIETQDSTFKNGSPMIWDSWQNFTHDKHSPAVFIFPVSDTHLFEYRYGPFKKRIENIYKGIQTSSYSDGKLITKGTPKTICRFKTKSHYKTKNCQAGFGRLKAFPLRVISKKSIRVKTILSRDELGPTDRADMW